jgi:hypothetical protein
MSNLIRFVFLVISLFFVSTTIAGDYAQITEKACADCITKERIIALAKERAKAQGYDNSKLGFDANWNGRVWYVTVTVDRNTPGSHFSYEYSRTGEFIKVHGGA